MYENECMYGSVPSMYQFNSKSASEPDRLLGGVEWEDGERGERFRQWERMNKSNRVSFIHSEFSFFYCSII